MTECSYSFFFFFHYFTTVHTNKKNEKKRQLKRIQNVLHVERIKKQQTTTVYT